MDSGFRRRAVRTVPKGLKGLKPEGDELGERLEAARRASVPPAAILAALVFLLFGGPVNTQEEMPKGKGGQPGQARPPPSPSPTLVRVRGALRLA
jgi:hypothetical protein